MTKFKVGDKVKLKSNIKKHEDYDGFFLTDGMYNMKGQILTIEKIVSEGFYKILEDTGNCTWTDGMLVKAKEELKIEDFSGITEALEKGFKENSKDIGKMLDKMSDMLKQMKEESPVEKAMKEAIIEKGRDIAIEDLENRLKEKLDKFIQEKYGLLPKEVIIKQNKTQVKLKGIFHKDFDKICNIVANDIPLMLVGGAGAGKNYTLEQVAKGLGLTFYSTNAINQEYKLTGFIDANGIYHETEFYKAFKDGGMFFLDEIDASSPEALIILNSAIANRYFDFPIGRIETNKDFRDNSNSKTQKQFAEGI